MSPPFRTPGKKIRFLDILLGLGLTVFVAFLFFVPFNFFETAHCKLYDLSLKMRGSLTPLPGLAIVAIDDASLAKVGRWPWPRGKIADLIDRLSEAGAEIIAVDIVFLAGHEEKAGGSDQLFGEAARRAGNVIFPFYFTLGKSKEGATKADMASPIAAASFLLFDDPKKFIDFPPPPAKEIFAPPLEIAQGARALGHINVLPDKDGKARWDPLIIEYDGHYYPSFSLQIAASVLKVSRGDITVRVGHSIRLGKEKIPTNTQGMMLINYYGGNQTFPYHSAADVLAGKSPAGTFKGKIVLVGVTAAGTSAGAHDLMATPFSNQFPGVEKHAHEVASVLQGRFISRPTWVSFGEFGLILGIGLLLTFLLPKVRPIYQLAVSLIVLGALGGLMIAAIFQGTWVKIFFPGLLVILQYVAVTARPAPLAQKETTRATDITGIVQGEGELSAAANGTSRPEVPSLMQKIGRYEILGELGRGAMGVVYKGRDPIIDRLVAIKTIRFDRFYEEQEIQNLKERFFKEAQAAGKLIHPNIVTIFDVGEDKGFSFMAMEYVEGESLAKFTARDRLLPSGKVVTLIIEAAEALDFAHRRGIVHRDVKPANIMLAPTGQVKVMDFGIAKLPTSTLTQTGSILGTPAYMSPEQINGQEIDGRSDLFSLGSVLYELLTGTKPFKGETLSALSYQITQGTPLPVSRLNPAIPPSCDEVLLQALAKAQQDRFQSGKDMAEALKKIVKKTGKT
ncbi:MAG: CHASE2 domain-containing protein [Deltaproteobacteria bacterium]|nr:CHASE2 domain-containing protein [Deltaproteobacteria bacterium]